MATAPCKQGMPKQAVATCCCRETAPDNGVRFGAADRTTSKGWPQLHRYSEKYAQWRRWKPMGGPSRPPETWEAPQGPRRPPSDARGSERCQGPHWTQEAPQNPKTLQHHHEKSSTSNTNALVNRENTASNWCQAAWLKRRRKFREAPTLPRNAPGVPRKTLADLKKPQEGPTPQGAPRPKRGPRSASK